MHGPDDMVEPRVLGAREHEVGESELFDVTEALELARFDDFPLIFSKPNIPVDRIAQDARIFRSSPESVTGAGFMRLVARPAVRRSPSAP
jgi:hypothetical protein